MVKINLKLSIGFIIIIILFSNSISATSYPYNQKITITDSDGSSMGYLMPYQKEVFFKDYAYLKWKRSGFPEANTFPIALIKGTTVPLPFGLEGELLKVKINSIGSSSIDLTIDKSDVITEIQNIAETLPENIEAISDEIEEQTEEIIEEVDRVVSEFLNQFSSRVEKAINRGYHSSLHILSSNANSVERTIDIKIKNKEADFAEKIADRIIPLLIDTFVAGTIPITSTTYTAIVSQIPSSVRHEITQYLYNIGTDYETQYPSDYLLSKTGAVTIFIGNPSRNKFSSYLNDELKKLNLPYFDNEKIIGKRSYTEDSIGLIAAIPEEKVWFSNTLQNRWNNDKIRLYKTMVAGISDSGLEAAAKWYNDQLDNARRLITSVVSLTDGADSSDILKIVSDNFNNNPKSTISSAALLQGWILTGLSSLQSNQFDRTDSLGYVAIVKKNGNSYDVLEVHTINGYKTNYFLNPYEIVEKVEEVKEVVEQASEIAEMVSEIEEGNVEEVVEDVTEHILEEAVEESQEKITGRVVEDVKEEPEPKKEIPIIGWIVNLFRGWFG